MKKIIFAALSVLLMFSLVGCGEHVDYTPNKDFSTGDIAGDMDGWAGSKWKSADAGNYIYVYEFTAQKAMDSDGDGLLKFKVRGKAGEWDGGDFGGATLEADKEVELKSADFGGPEAKLAFKDGNKYRITISSKDGKVYATLKDLGAGVVPVPYLLEGLVVTTGEEPTLAGALMTYSKDLDANVTYKVKFVADGTTQKFAITDVAGKVKYTSDKAIELTKSVDLKAAGTNDKATTITGLEAGSRYEVTITTTPAGKVSVVVDDSPIEVTFKFELTGLTEGNKAWINGSFWGSTWPNGWPIEKWGGRGEKFKDVSPVAADANGVVKFPEAFDAKVSVKPNVEYVYEFKPIVSKSGNFTTDAGEEWEESDKVFNPGENLKYTLTASESCTFIISVNVKTSEVTATKK